MTTTLIKRSTPRPLKVIPRIIRPHDPMTIAASNRLNPSIRNVPDDANVFKAISMKKTLRKTKSIMLTNSASISKNWEIVKSKSMKIEYRPIVRRDRFSINWCWRVRRQQFLSFGMANSCFTSLSAGLMKSFSFILKYPKRFTTIKWITASVPNYLTWSMHHVTAKVMNTRKESPVDATTMA